MESCGLSYVETVARPKPVFQRGGAGGRWDGRSGGRGPGGGRWGTENKLAGTGGGRSGPAIERISEAPSTTLELDPPLDQLLAFGCSLADGSSDANASSVDNNIAHSVRSPPFRQLIYLEQRKLSILLQGKRLQQDKAQAVLGTGQSACLPCADTATVSPGQRKMSSSVVDGQDARVRPGLASQAVAAASELVALYITAANHADFFYS